MSERLNETAVRTYDLQDIRVMTTFGEGGAPLADSVIKVGDKFAVPAAEAVSNPKSVAEVTPLIEPAGLRA